MSFALIALLFAAADLQAAPECAVPRAAEYTNTNQLVWDKGFRPALECFLGGARAEYLDSDDTIVNQMIEVLHGPPDKRASIGELFRFTACRQHSCPEKGAAVFTPGGAIVALAILHSACVPRPSPKDCFAHDTLTIFVRDVSNNQPVIDDLSDWAKKVIAEEYHAPSQRATTLDKVEVKPVSP